MAEPLSKHPYSLRVRPSYMASLEIRQVPCLGIGKTMQGSGLVIMLKSRDTNGINGLQIDITVLPQTGRIYQHVPDAAYHQPGVIMHDGHYLYQFHPQLHPALVHKRRGEPFDPVRREFADIELGNIGCEPGRGIVGLLHEGRMHMVKGIDPCGQNIPERVAGHSYWTLDETHQRGIGAQVHHGRENGEIGPAVFIRGTDEHGGLVPRDAVDQVSPVEALVARDIPGTEM